MAFWFWGIILLLLFFGLSRYMEVKISVRIQEDESFQGLYLKINSPIYKINRQYDYTNPDLHLIESILADLFVKSETDVASTAASDYRSICKGFSIKNILRHYLPNNKIFFWVLRFLKVDYLEWKSTVGSQDALYTALGTGACWALKGVVIGVLSHRCRVGCLKLDVRPDYLTPHFFSTLTCILKVRMVHIIIIEICILAKKVRWCINGITAGTTIQPSH